MNDQGETTLHAVCLSGWWSTMYYLVARGVNPLALTKEGGGGFSAPVRRAERKLSSKDGGRVRQAGLQHTPAAADRCSEELDGRCSACTVVRHVLSALYVSASLRRPVWLARRDADAV